VNQEPTLRTIRLFGELDLHSARAMSATLSEAVGDTTRDPVVDLRRVTFMDSTALGALARAGEQLRNQGRTLKLLLVDGQVRDLLDVSGLADRFELLSAPRGGAPGSTPGPAAVA
jgi:anti-anti-sigma factor